MSFYNNAVASLYTTNCYSLFLNMLYLLPAASNRLCLTVMVITAQKRSECTGYVMLLLLKSVGVIMVPIVSGKTDKL